MIVIIIDNNNNNNNNNRMISNTSTVYDILLTPQVMVPVDAGIN